MVTRAMCWRLHLATGAGIQAKKVSAELGLRAGASDRFERLLDTANNNLEQAKLLHQEALEEIARLNLEVEELRGLRLKHDEACSALSKIKSGHAEEMGALRKRFSESWNKLRWDAAEEKSRLSKRLGEVEEKAQRLQQDVVARDDRSKWDQEKIKLLTGELSQSREEANNKQLRINDLKDRVDQAKADKLRAFGDVERLSEVVTRLEKEMEDIKSESRSRQEMLQGELSSVRQRSSVLEAQVVESEGQVALRQNRIAEAEKQLAFFLGEQDATCAEAFQLGAEDVRSKIARAHPEWDLSFLEVGGHGAQTSGAELSTETEYEEVSDTDLEALPRDDAAVDSGEKGRSCPSVAGAAEVQPIAPKPSVASPSSAIDGSDVGPSS